MTDFQNCLAEHLASELDCELSKVTEALNAFPRTIPEELPKETPPKKSSAKKTSKATEEIHYCQRIPRKHDKPCGKRARNQVETLDGTKQWFCGTKKSGCTRIQLGHLEKEREKRAAKKISEEAIENRTKKKSGTSGGSNKDRRERTDRKTESFLKKAGVIRRKTQARKIKTKTNGTVFMDHDTRIVFDRSTNEAYGVLSKEDNDTILPLGKEEIDWLEFVSLSFRLSKEKTTSSKKEKLREEIKDLDSENFEDQEDFDAEEPPEEGNSGSKEDSQTESGSDSEEEYDLDDM